MAIGWQSDGNRMAIGWQSDGKQMSITQRYSDGTQRAIQRAIRRTPLGALHEGHLLDLVGQLGAQVDAQRRWVIPRQLRHRE